MVDGSKRKNVRLIVICSACILVVAALIYGLSKAAGAPGQREDTKQSEDMAHDELTQDSLLQEGMPQDVGYDNASVRADTEPMSQEGVMLQEGTVLQQEAMRDGQAADAAALSELSHEGDKDKLKDKTVSILGDSISTYEGWIPNGYVDFFPMNGEVDDVDETWWKMLIDDNGMQFCANSSSAGSTCVGDSLSVDNPKFACSNYRIDDLIGKGGVYPDIIIIYMGTNDLLTNVPIGENDGTQPVEEGIIDNFSDAYSLILDKLESQYPGAQIFCCTLAQIGDWGDTKPFVTFENSKGLTSADYDRQIKSIADNRGFTVIDLYDCGITIDNMQKYVTDGVHLNTEGMKLVKNAVEEALME